MPNKVIAENLILVSLFEVLIVVVVVVALVIFCRPPPKSLRSIKLDSLTLVTDLNPILEDRTHQRARGLLPMVLA